MQLVTLKKATSPASFAARRGIDEAALMRINDIERPGILPAGMSLLLPGKSLPRSRPIELLAGGTRYPPDCAAGALYYPVGILDFESCSLPTEHRGEALSLLALRNTDESGFVSPRLAHSLLCDEERSRQLGEALANKLEREGWGGLLLSMEYLFPFDRGAYTGFVRFMEKVLHKAGCWLILALPAAALTEKDSRCAAPYDFRALSELCDRLIISSTDIWDGPGLESFMSRPEVAAAAGKLLIHLSPLSHISRPGHKAPISPSAAQNLAISVKAPISRKDPCAPACFDCTDAAFQPCRVCYTDLLWFETLLEKIQGFGLAGISCTEIQALCPGAKALFSGIIPLQSLI